MDPEQRKLEDMDPKRRRIVERTGLFLEMLDNLPNELRAGDPDRVEAIRELIEERRQAGRAES